MYNVINIEYHKLYKIQNRTKQECNIFKIEILELNLEYKKAKT